MLATWQEFKFGPIKKKLNLVSSKSSHEPQFVYLPDVLKAFKIQEVTEFEVNGEFEADGGIINYIRDDNGIMYHPKRIPCYPGCVIEVVYEAPQSDLTSLTSTADRESSSPLDEYVDQLNIKNQLSTDLGPSESLHFGLPRESTKQIQADMKAATDAMIAKNRAGKLDTPAAYSILEESLAASGKNMGSFVTAKPGFESTIISKLDVLHDQGHLTQQMVRQVLEEMQQIKDRLTLIQSKTEAILTQQLELAEYPIPRLFIVLPEEPTKYDPGNWFRTKFRLHFICECGEHTKAAGGKIPNHLHLAKHEGYLIREPTTFFKKYGPFLLLMLGLIKFGTDIAGHVVPALASFKVIELVDSVQQTVESFTAKIDYSLECIDRQLAKIQASYPGDFIDTEPRAAITQQDLANYLSDVEGLEGVELRQLGSFLRTSEEENLLGNLYRMTTSNGHVKWVCRDHFRASYQEAHNLKLRNVVKMDQGTFDEQLGRIEITLKSSFAATEFYDAINKAKGVLELIVNLNWGCTGGDLEALENALKKSRVPILRLDLRNFRVTVQLLSGSPQHEALFRIIKLPSMRAIHIVLPGVFIDFFGFQPEGLPHLQKLSFEIIVGMSKGKEIRILAEMLKTNSTLTTWHLYSNSTGDSGAQALSDAPKANSAPTTLNLNRNWIGFRGAQVLFEALKTNSTLTTLDLEYSGIESSGARALSEVLKTNSTLTILNLLHDSIGDDGAQALFEALKTNSTLTTLSLSDNKIGDNGARALYDTLKTNSTITILDLSNNSIGDNGAKALSEALKINSTLTTLDFSNNKIGDNGAKVLSDALKTNSALVALNLERSSIGSDGAQALYEALKTNSTLTTLSLSNNKIGDNGARALYEALKANSTLTTLGLSKNKIGGNGAQALSEALKINSTLTTLDLSNNKVGGNGAKALFDALKTNSTLIALDLQLNSIGPDGIQTLSEALKTNSTLTTLNLTCNLIGDNRAQVLFEALKTNSTLTTLHLATEDRGAQVLSEILKTNLTLTALDLKYGFIGSNGAQALSEALKTNSTLTILCLGNNSVGDSGAQALSEALRTNSTLITLDLSKNKIGNDGVQVLSEALKTNSTLTTLDLSNIRIGDSGVQVLSEVLKINSTLITLGLSDNKIGDNGAQVLSGALKTNLTLTTLDLSGNRIGDHGAQALSEALKTNSTLAALNLSENKIGDKGALALRQVSQCRISGAFVFINII